VCIGIRYQKGRFFLELRVCKPLKNLTRVSKIARVHLTQCCNLCYYFIRVVSSLKLGEAYDDRRNPVSHIERWGFIFSQMPISNYDANGLLVVK
jgi:hypothetical protein